MLFLRRTESSSVYIYAYPHLTLQGFIDIVSTPERWIYMCEHEKSTLLHLVQSLAYHTRLITAASTGECSHRGHARTKSLSSDKDRGDGKSKDTAHWPGLLKYNPRLQWLPLDCETSGYFCREVSAFQWISSMTHQDTSKETSGQFPVIFVATKADILGQNMIFSKQYLSGFRN